MMLENELAYLLHPSFCYYACWKNTEMSSEHASMSPLKDSSTQTTQPWCSLTHYGLGILGDIELFIQVMTCRLLCAKPLSNHCWLIVN